MLVGSYRGITSTMKVTLKRFPQTSVLTTKALEYYKKALETEYMHPTQWAIHNRLAATYTKLGVRVVLHQLIGTGT